MHESVQVHTSELGWKNRESARVSERVEGGIESGCKLQRREGVGRVSGAWVGREGKGQGVMYWGEGKRGWREAREIWREGYSLTLKGCYVI